MSAAEMDRVILLLLVVAVVVLLIIIVCLFIYLIFDVSRFLLCSNIVPYC